MTDPDAKCHWDRLHAKYPALGGKEHAKHTQERWQVSDAFAAACDATTAESVRWFADLLIAVKTGVTPYNAAMEAITKAAEIRA